MADQIVERGLKNTFRFGPGYGTVRAGGGEQPARAQHARPGKPAKTVMIVHEESLFGTGTANLLARELPGFGFEVKEVIKHANPTRDFNNIVLRIKVVNPDIVIPANYYNEYVLLVRTHAAAEGAAQGDLLGARRRGVELQVRQGVSRTRPTASSTATTGSTRRTSARRRCASAVEAKGLFFTYEVFITYTAVRLLADAIERAEVAPTAAPSPTALAASTFSDHFMPYGPTKFVNGQNQGAQPLMTQVVKGDIEVIVPRDYREVRAGLPAARPERAAARRGPGAMFDFDILFPSVLNGLTTGAVYALVALGPDADLRRAAHHQLRAWRAADGGAVRASTC